MSVSTDVPLDQTAKSVLEHSLSVQSLESLRTGISLVYCGTMLAAILPSLPWLANWLPQLAFQISVFLIVQTLAAVAITGQLFCMSTAKEIRATGLLIASLVLTVICLVLGGIACGIYPSYVSELSRSYYGALGLLGNMASMTMSVMLLVSLNLACYSHFLAKIVRCSQRKDLISTAETAAKYWRISWTLIVSGGLVFLTVGILGLWSGLLVIGCVVYSIGFVFGMAAYLTQLWTLHRLNGVLRSM